MKRVTVLLFLIAFTCKSFGTMHLITVDEVRAVKQGKIIIGLSGVYDVDKSLKQAARLFWDFGRVIDALPQQEALKRAKEDPTVYMLAIMKVQDEKFFTKEDYKEHPNIDDQHVQIGTGLAITDGNDYPMYCQFFPTLSEHANIHDGPLVFAFRSMNHLFTALDQRGMKSNWKVDQLYGADSKQLANKTLYMVDSWMSDGITPENLQRIYNAPVKVVDYKTWENAILYQKKGIAYAMIVPSPVMMDGTVVCQHYLMDAETATIFGIVETSFTASVMNYDNKMKKDGFIHKQMLEKYDGITKGEW